MGIQSNTKPDDVRSILVFFTEEECVHLIGASAFMMTQIRAEIAGLHTCPECRGANHVDEINKLAEIDDYYKSLINRLFGSIMQRKRLQEERN